MGIVSNAEIRAMARNQLRGNWGKAILASLIIAIVAGVLGRIPIVGPIAALLITGSLSLGLCMFYLRLSRREAPSVGAVFDGFSRFVDAFVLYVLVAVFVFLWSLLLIIPGIIAAFRYSMAYYLLADNPGMKPLDAIRKSKEMMVGHKMQLFLLGLSFIGWAILCIITLGIGFLWLSPYISTAQANFYEQVKTAGANG